MKRGWSAIAAITAVAVLGRLVLLREPMRFDEAVSWAYYVGRSWATIVGTYKQPNNHVFYSLLAKATAAPFGYPPWALRLPAFAAGVAIVPLTWAVGRRFADETSALLAAALCAGSTQLTLYSVNARGYSLVVALFLVQLLVADRLIAVHNGSLDADAAADRAGRAHRAQWALLGVLGAIGLYTIPVMLYPLGIVFTWIALSALHLPSRARTALLVHAAITFASALVIAGVLYLPIIGTAGIDALFGNKFVAASPWNEFVGEVPHNFLGTVGRWVSPFPWWSAPIAVALALLGVFRRAPSGRSRLAVAALLWCTLLLIATHRAPFHRVWLFLLPLFLLSVARGALWCVHRMHAGEMRHRGAAAVTIAVLSVALSLGRRSVQKNDDTGAFRPAESMTAVLAPKLRPGDRVLAPIPSIGPMLYYFPRVGADTSLLTVPLERANRAFLVLDLVAGQTLEWAVRSGMIDPVQFPQPTLIAKYPGAELWEVARTR